ncbi:hypothetical protein DYB34_011177, partial [Aphanomyces astaci]
MSALDSEMEAYGYATDLIIVLDIKATDKWNMKSEEMRRFVDGLTALAALECDERGTQIRRMLLAQGPTAVQNLVDALSCREMLLKCKGASALGSICMCPLAAATLMERHSASIVHGLLRMIQTKNRWAQGDACFVLGWIVRWSAPDSSSILLQIAEHVPRVCDALTSTFIVPSSSAPSANNSDDQDRESNLRIYPLVLLLNLSQQVPDIGAFAPSILRALEVVFHEVVAASSMDERSIIAQLAVSVLYTLTHRSSTLCQMVLELKLVPTLAKMTKLPLDSPDIAQQIRVVSTAPEATLPSFEASIPGTLEDDHTQTSNNESLKHRANFDVPKSPNANTQPVQETSSKKSPRSEEVATRPLTKEVSIANILQSVLGESDVQVVHMPPKSMSKEASIANILSDALCDATVVNHRPVQYRPTPSMTKGASIANILKNALGDDATTVVHAQPHVLTKEVSIANILRNALDDEDERGSAAAISKAPQTLSKEASIAHIITSALEDSDVSTVVPSTRLRDFEIGAAVAHLNAPLDTPQSTNRSDIDVPPLLQNSRSSRRMDQLESQGSTLSRGLNTSPSKAELVPSASRAELNRLLSESQASSPGTSADTMAASDGGSHAARSELNRIFLETQREVQSVGGDSDVSLYTPVLPKLLPVRTNARASFTRSSQEQASSILQTTARLQSSTRTSFRQARLSNADVESLIS